VGVVVTVAVLVGVGPWVGAVTFPVARNPAKTTTAPIRMNSTSSPNAAGRDNVRLGMRLPCTEVLTDFVSAEGVISVPQTRQREAVSLSLVPQVGQILDVDGSGLIATALYHDHFDRVAHIQFSREIAGKLIQ
jgi:hypothetical protein